MLISLARLPKPLLLVLLTSAVPWPNKVSAFQGDSWCGTLMCVKAIVNVNSSTITYELKSLNQLGWMAIGFGSQMANTSMVILWQTINGTTILSQRQASGHVEPLPIPDPPQQAIITPPVDPSPSVSPILSFDISNNNDTLQSLIWAFGVTTPASDPAAFIEQHLDAGAFRLNLTKELDASQASECPSASITGPGSGALAETTAPSLLAQSVSSSPPAASTSSTSSGSGGPSRTDALLVVHAALSAAGFLIVLPLGTLVARWARVFTPKWFTAHWLINVVLGIPLVCVGWALGPLAVAQLGEEHIVTAHQICGVVLFVLYLVEVALGTLIHLRRQKDGRSHPPRNVVHVVMGLAIFGLSIFETVSGVVRDSAEGGASQTIVVAICIGWSVVFAGTYGIGLLFLRRQFAQERLGWNVPSSVPLPLSIVTQDTSASSSSFRRRTGTVDGPMADDGTHDVFSHPWTDSVEYIGAQNEVADSRTEIEMRQVQAVPVTISISALL